ncbi:hypothetical protein [Fusobacterium sp. HC1336]|uniref:hypothetical protein n=1 Tax=Fusobacterium sp. HC1336 TaxID=3171169 RepID=UPI003F1FA48E
MHFILGIIVLAMLAWVLTNLIKIALYLFGYLLLLIFITIFLGKMGFLIGIILVIGHGIYLWKNNEFFD